MRVGRGSEFVGFGYTSRMNSYWRWKCEECGYEFILALVRLPQPCHRCGGEWFLKIGEVAYQRISN